MKGRITVMTIMTGVKSPWILGKPTRADEVHEKRHVEEELGIEIIE
jgi:hypothetical protein